MKRISCWLLVMQGLFATAAWAAEPIGRVEELSGTVTAQGVDGATRELGSGSEIFLRDRVLTGDRAKLRIRFLDDSTVSQGERAEMIIDEYVYAPAKKSENSAIFQLVRGAFRIITDKITKLNPERFEVKTNYGTIGIRGCDLGFRLDADREEIFVVSLDTADRVVIKSDLPGAQGVHEIRADGIFVLLSPGLGYEERPFRADEIRNLELETTMGTPPPAPAGHAQSKSDTPEDQEIKGPDDTVAHETPEVNQLAGLNTLIALDNTSREKDLTENTTTPVPAAPADDLPDNTTPGTEPATPGNQPTPRPPTSDDGGTVTPVFPQVGPKKTMASGSGADWSWGVWSRDVVDLVGGSPVSSFRTGTDTSGAGLSSADFQALALGGVLYNLSGSGPAGALVSQGSQLSLLQGTVNIGVTLGLGILPTWQADFGLAGVGQDSLNFTVPGSIQADGALKGSPSSYTLNAFGQSHGSSSLTRQDVNGKLVGAGTGAKPISGAVVDFHFEHGASGPIVDGAGGADLQ